MADGGQASARNRRVSALRYAGLGAGIALLCSSALIQEDRATGLLSSLGHRLKGYWQLAAGSRITLAPFTMLAGSAMIAGQGVAAPVPAAVPPTEIGINITSTNWYSNQRAFANLALGGYWQLGGSGKGWQDLPAANANPDGSLRSIPEGSEAMRMLTRPNTGASGATIRCTYSGKGAITAKGEAKNVTASSGQLRFQWVNRWANNNVWLQIASIDPQDPIRDIDCREDTMPKDARFDPAFVASLKGYKVLRFMDWQRTNANAPVTWATRHTPASFNLAEGDGVSIEDIMAFTAMVGADPWLTTPWNADDDYIERFARYVHDHLAPGRAVYVETSNEVWNLGFPVARQARQEGTERGLSSNPREQQLFRYAQRSVEVMKIWERVFADNPKRLIRVVSTQQVVPASAELVLGWGDLASHVDALATAPYFGFDLMKEGQTSDLTEIFARLDDRVDRAIATAGANKKIAARYGKRYLAYEAGQHIVLRTDVPLLQSIQRDPRMYAAYKRYIRGWKAHIGDTLMLFGTTGEIGRGGAWGLVEHSGQPASEAPKLRAALEER